MPTQEGEEGEEGGHHEHDDDDGEVDGRRVGRVQVRLNVLTCNRETE